MALVSRLTTEQEKQLSATYEEFSAIGLATGPTDRKVFRAAVTTILKEGGYEVPPFVWVKSPVAASAEIEKRKKGHARRRKVPTEMYYPYFGQRGSIEAYWLATPRAHR